MVIRWGVIIAGVSFAGVPCSGAVFTGYSLVCHSLGCDVFYVLFSCLGTSLVAASSHEARKAQVHVTSSRAACRWNCLKMQLSSAFWSMDARAVPFFAFPRLQGGSMVL